MAIPPSSLDENALLQQVAAKDRQALSTLYDRYAHVVYTLAYRVLGNAEESEEIVLDVFSQVWRTAGSYDAAKGRVDTWLFMITRSRALDRLRSLTRNAKAVTASKEAISVQANNQITGQNSGQNPIEYAISQERGSLVNSALEKLPPEQREVIELAYYKGMTHTQIALITGKSLGTIKTRIRLGLHKLRESIPQDWLK